MNVEQFGGHLRLVMPSAAGDAPESFDAEIEHRDPAQPGEVEILRAGETTWIAAPGGALHAAIIRA